MGEVDVQHGLGNLAETFPSFLQAPKMRPCWDSLDDCRKRMLMSASPAVATVVVGAVVAEVAVIVVAALLIACERPSALTGAAAAVELVDGAAAEGEAAVDVDRAVAALALG